MRNYQLHLTLDQLKYKGQTKEEFQKTFFQVEKKLTRSRLNQD